MQIKADNTVTESPEGPFRGLTAAIRAALRPDLLPGPASRAVRFGAAHRHLWHCPSDGVEGQGAAAPNPEGSGGIWEQSWPSNDFPVQCQPLSQPLLGLWWMPFTFVGGVLAYQRGDWL